MALLLVVVENVDFCWHFRTAAIEGWTNWESPEGCWGDAILIANLFALVASSKEKGLKGQVCSASKTRIKRRSNRGESSHSGNGQSMRAQAKEQATKRGWTTLLVLHFKWSLRNPGLMASHLSHDGEVELHDQRIVSVLGRLFGCLTLLLASPLPFWIRHRRRVFFK